MSDQKSIGKIASDQVRRMLVNVDDRTLRMLTRALPMLERVVEEMMADFGPYARLLDDPQAMLFLLANSRDSISAIATKQPPTLDEQAAQFLTTGANQAAKRARIWVEVHKAIRRGNASMALVCLRALVGHDGWTQFTIDSL